jgi:dipeptidyl aminopeptidase/acylaminoacyl peptidase
MRKSLVYVVVLTGLFAGCGKNQVTVEIRGGDGNLVRLDANELQYKANHLRPAGRNSFPTADSQLEVRKGIYTVNVATSGYLATQVLTVDSPPISGVQEYSLEFAIAPGDNAAPQLTGTILYAATPANVNNWDLYTIQGDGQQRTRLTDTREFEQHPAWSPDGERIAYTRGDVMSNIDIWLMDADGTHHQRLTEHPERDQRAAWSPDGTGIAFVSQRDGDVAIWLMDADGSNQRRLVKGREPAWSPDGRRITFTSGQYEGWDEIYVVDATGENLQRLTFDKGKFDMFPAWSPDGTRIVFDTERFGGQELMLMLPDGSGQTRITIAEHTYESEPVWSPDGRALAYSGKMNLGSDGEILTYKNGRPMGASDIFVVGAAGFDWDTTPRGEVRPVNLTRTEDWEEKSPSWRDY